MGDGLCAYCFGREEDNEYYTIRGMIIRPTH